MSEPSSAVAPQRSSRRQILAVAGAAAVLVAGSSVYRWRASETDPKLTAFEPHPAPRDLAPLRFSDEAGRELSLASFRGRVVLLNVWATWCPPCVQEMPTLDRLQAALGGSTFEVVTVSMDSGGLSVVQAFFRQIGVKHLHPYLDAFQEVGNLGAMGIPLTLLVDREGREAGRKLGPATWDDPKVVQTIRGYLTIPEKS
ncbi:MAG: TlpA family protein disulfide reductase [Pseudomonadota bacterium]|nr:TlpA family protein disulfide reductase [Pseudomonadota bacterium]